MISFKSEINPKGRTVEERQADLIRQLRLQTEELKVIIQDLYKKLEEKKQ